jgi:hypothetical protein
LALYAATVLSELPVLLVRMLLTLPAAATVLLLKDGSITGADGYWELALIPTSWALLALLTPLGGAHWWRMNLGGREPSERERLAYDDAVELLAAHGRVALRLPRVWFVLDTPQPDGAVCGDALMLSRGLLESEFLAPVLAHELGHLATSDGKLTAALNRLVITPFPWRQPAERRGGRPSSSPASGRCLASLSSAVCSGSPGACFDSPAAASRCGCWHRSGALTGASASMPPISTRLGSGRPRSSPSSSRSTP